MSPSYNDVLMSCYSFDELGVLSSIAALVIAKTALSSTLVWKIILFGLSCHISVLNVSPGNTYIANCACTYSLGVSRS